nr:hypothetical protein [Bacteroidota bacterium]
MITAIKIFFKTLLLPVLYFGGLGAVIASFFKEVKWVFLLLVFLIPQPNVWYKLHSYPLGKDFLDLLFVACLVGILRQGDRISKSRNFPIIVIFILYSYFSLIISSFNFGMPFPVSLSNSLVLDWKNYAQMVVLYFFAFSLVKDKDYIKLVTTLMGLVILIISIRSYRGFHTGSTFSYDKRYGGPFEFVGLGANHLGAFIAYTWSFFLGIFAIAKDKVLKWLSLANIIVGLHPLFFSYSRGAYLAALASFGFCGSLRKKSWLIILAIFLFSWQVFLPASVTDRIEMTETESGELEESADLRFLA